MKYRRMKKKYKSSSWEIWKHQTFSVSTKPFCLKLQLALSSCWETKNMSAYNWLDDFALGNSLDFKNERIYNLLTSNVFLILRDLCH